MTCEEKTKNKQRNKTAPSIDHAFKGTPSVECIVVKEMPIVNVQSGWKNFNQLHGLIM